MALQLSTGLRNSMLDTASFQDSLTNGVLYIYSGTQPASPDSAATGTLLLTITKASGAFSAGTATNGINFDAASGGVVSKAAAEVWSGVATSSGTAGYFRFCGNAALDAPSATATTSRRFDGAIGTSGAQLNMASTTITSGATTTIDTFTVTLPAS